MRLDGTRESKEFSLWFATPASRTATTRCESLVLEAVLAVAGSLESNDGVGVAKWCRLVPAEKRPSR